MAPVACMPMLQASTNSSHTLGVGALLCPSHRGCRDSGWSCCDHNGHKRMHIEAKLCRCAPFGGQSA